MRDDSDNVEAIDASGDKDFEAALKKSMFFPKVRPDSHTWPSKANKVAFPPTAEPAKKIKVIIK